MGWPCSVAKRFDGVAICLEKVSLQRASASYAEGSPYNLGPRRAVLKFSKPFSVVVGGTVKVLKHAITYFEILQCLGYVGGF